MLDTARAKFVPALALTVLVIWIALGACQWARLRSGHPVGTDHFVYSLAVHKAWAGQDPYLPHSIGWGFLYPPPALLLLKAVELITPACLNPTYTFITLSVIAAVAGVGLLGNQGWWRACIAVALLGSAGMIETIYLGQINALVVLCIALFFWASSRERHLLGCGALAVAVSLKVTPAVFALLFLVRGKLRWLITLAACVAGLLLAAEALIPASHVTASFLTSIRWASKEAAFSKSNYSLSSTLPALVQSWGCTLEWRVVHRIKLLVLAALLGATYVAYLRLGSAATRSLLVTCNICMVIAPNLVWLHHMALLVPALWILLTESKSRTLIAVSLVALLCIQSTACANMFLHVRPAVLMDLAQLMLSAAGALSTGLLFRPVGRYLWGDEEDTFGAKVDTVSRTAIDGNAVVQTNRLRVRSPRAAR